MTDSGRPDAERDQGWAWEIYWRGGRLDSCIATSNPAVAVDLRRWWAAYFAALPKNARILDVGTGNGVLALTALEAGTKAGKSFRIHGADLAEIRPADWVKEERKRLRMIEFRGGVGIEALPYAGASFDAVVGQYALEYADCDRAIAEVMRVLAPGGSFRFLMHAYHGAVAQQNKSHLAERTWLRRESGMIDAARRLASATYTALASSAHSAQLVLARDLSARAQAGISRFQPTTGAPLVQQIHAALQQVHVLGRQRPLKELGQMFDEIELRLDAEISRLEALSAAALTEEDLSEVIATFETCGATGTQSEPLMLGRNRNFLGWHVEGSRGR